MMPHKSAARLLDYVNIEHRIGMVVSSRLATLHELQTVYGVTDLYKMMEVITIDRYNDRVLNDG